MSNKPDADYDSEAFRAAAKRLLPHSLDQIKKARSAMTSPAPDAAKTFEQKLRKLIWAARVRGTYDGPHGHMFLGYAEAKGELHSAKLALTAARDALRAEVERLNSVYTGNSYTVDTLHGDFRVILHFDSRAGVDAFTQFIIENVQTRAALAPREKPE